ncbi:MAG: gamma-glutamyltransferase, partial [Rhodospirillaceae bacterium]
MPPVRLVVGSGPPELPPPKYVGFAVADEPQAALAARGVLLAGGNAADAATALGLALAVTLPSSAGLGGGGACVVYQSATAKAESLTFIPQGDDVAAPVLARGLFALHAKYGSTPWPQVVAPAENLARFGAPVSRAFARDLSAYGSSLIADRTALGAFMTQRRRVLQAGDTFVQP